MYGSPSGASRTPLPRPGAEEAAARDRVDRLGELVAVAGRVGEGVEPDRDAVLDVRDRRGRARSAPSGEEPDPAGDVEPARRRHVEHGQEDREVEERRRRGRSSGRGRASRRPRAAAAARSAWATGCPRPATEHLPVVAQVAGQEDDEQDLRELARLELDRPDPHPERGAVDRLAEAGQRREGEQDDGGEAEHVLDAVEAPVVAERRGRAPRRARPRRRARAPGGRRRSGSIR